jgi:2'-5' RNA ligase
VGVKGDVDKLLVITDRIRDGLRDMKLQIDERRFVPHIAIAKVNNYQTPEEIERQLQTMIFGEFQPITINSVKLYESVADGGFHKHNTLAQIPLEN